MAELTIISSKGEIVLGLYTLQILKRSSAFRLVTAAMSLGCTELAQADLVYSWGNNQYGQIGNGTLVNQTTPYALTALGSDITSASASANHSLAIKSGALYVWGRNNSGELGELPRSLYGPSTPIPNTTLTSGVTAISGGNTHSLVLKNGAVYAFGNCMYGQIGNGQSGNFAPDQETPYAIPSLSSNVTAIDAGRYSSFAIQNGTLYSWGDFVPLGRSQTTFWLPGPVTTLGDTVSAISAGAEHCLVIREGILYAWGNNSDGELGMGDKTSRSLPVVISGASSNVTAISAGGSHSMAIINGSVYIWGDNAYHQIGDGTTTDRLTPMLMSGLTDITQIMATESSSYALSSDGSLWVWGRNQYGQLGLGDTVDRFTPTHLLPPTGYRYSGIDGNGLGTFVLARVTAVPEPAALGLLSLGTMFLTRRRNDE